MGTADLPNSSALRLLNYLHLPTIAIIYCILYDYYGATSLGIRRRRIILRLILLFNFSYLAEVLYYAFLLLNKNELASDYAIVHVLSAMIVWMVLAVALSTTSSSLWQPYAGIFVIEFLFQAALSATNGILCGVVEGYVRAYKACLTVAFRSSSCDGPWLDTSIMCRRLYGWFSRNE
jgi:hypothetical protein